MNIEFEGDVSIAKSSTLTQVIETLTQRILARDTDLDLSVLSHVRVCDDIAATAARLGAGPVAGEHLSRLVADGPQWVLLVDGPRLREIVRGDGAEIARLIHHMHKEFWRIHYCRRGIAQIDKASPPSTPLTVALAPITTAMWQEYAINRHSAWSIPGDSDLLLNHLAALLQALPAGMQEEITLYFAAPDLEGLFGKTLGRIAHLLQAVAHVQGYLDGLEVDLATVSEPMAERVAKSFLAPLWPPIAHHLAAGLPHLPGDIADAPLRRDIQAAFAIFGLQVRDSEDGELWVDVTPLTPPPMVH